jgi:hypothetical protein
MLLMRGILTARRDSVFLAHDGGHSAAQADGKRVRRFGCSRKILEIELTVQNYTIASCELREPR